MPQPNSSQKSRELRHLLLEALVVVVAGLLLALGANAVSSRGIKITRDYFSALNPPPAPPPSTNKATENPQALPPTTNVTVGTPLPPALAQAAARLQQRGLQMATLQQALQLYRDARRLSGLVVFVDARNDRSYQEGHIPGAWQLDPYRHENYMAAVQPVCQQAEVVVVYCTGGDCEDSEMAAVMLAEAGIPKNRILVFAGGFDEWSANKLPVEKGARMPPQQPQSK